MPRVNNKFLKLTDRLNGQVQRGKRGINARDRKLNSCGSKEYTRLTRGKTDVFSVSYRKALSIAVKSHSKLIVFH